MQDFGFALLFKAQWYGGLGLSDTREETDVLFVRMQDEDALAGWESRWQEWSPAPSLRVFPPTPLDAPGTAFWRRHIRPLQRVPPRRIRNGCLLAGRGAPCVPVAGDRTVVGYSSLQELQDLAPLTRLPWAQHTVSVAIRRHAKLESLLPTKLVDPSRSVACEEDRSMSRPILTTKLYIPSPRLKVVRRPHLIERLNKGLYRKLTLNLCSRWFW